MATREATNNHASFHFWWEKKLVKHQKISKYYENDCRKLTLAKIDSFLHLHDCTFKTIFKFYLNLIFLSLQNLILPKYFNLFSHFLFLIKSNEKKISFEPKKKIKRLIWFLKVAFSIFGKKMNRVSYKIHHEIKDISRVK